MKSNIPYHSTKFSLFIALILNSTPARSEVRMDVSASAGIEYLKIEKAPNEPFTLPSLAGGGYSGTIGGEWFNTKSYGFGCDVTFNKFNSNAKLEQEQFTPGVLEKGTFELNATLVSFQPFFSYRLGESGRARIGFTYDQGLSGDTAVKIGIIDQKYDVQNLSRMGVSLGFDTVLWKGLFTGLQGTYKTGKRTLKSKLPEDTNTYVSNFISASAYATLGWQFGIGNSETSGADTPANTTNPTGKPANKKPLPNSGKPTPKKQNPPAIIN